MDILFFLLAIGWVIISAAGKKQKRQAQEQAKRDQGAADRQAATPGSFVQPAQEVSPVKSVPVQPPKPIIPRDESPKFDPYFVASEEPAATPIPSKQQPMRAPITQRTAAAPETRMREAIGSHLTQIQETNTGHILEASSISGHTHTESSMTGFANDCSEATAKAAKAAKARSGVDAAHRSNPAQGAPQATVPAPFLWNVNEVTRGVVMAEILGKPKALQR